MRTAPETALISTLGHYLDPDAVRPGACTCGAPGPSGCVCDMGRLYRQVLCVGWELSAAEAAHEIPGLLALANSILASQRRQKLHQIYLAWKGTDKSFRRAFGMAHTIFIRLELNKVAKEL